MTSRNKREGYYGGTHRKFDEIKTLGNGQHVFRLKSVKHVRWMKSISLRVLFSKARLREFTKMLEQLP